MLRKFAIKIKESVLGPVLLKLGIRRWTIARRMYGIMTKINTDKPANINGYVIFVDENDSLGLLSNNKFYENNPEVEAMKKFVRKGDAVIDIGANIGAYSLLLSRLVGKGGKVYAFEPDSDNFRTLIKNINANKCENIIPVRKAVSSETGKIKLYLAEWNKGDHRIYESDEKRDFSEIEAVSLDDYFRKNNEKISFIKMDVQGAEPLIFMGAKSTIEKQKPIILQEFWPAGIESSWGSHRKFLELLNLNFKIYDVNNTKDKMTAEEILSNVSVEQRNFINLLCIPKKGRIVKSKSVLH